MQIVTAGHGDHGGRGSEQVIAADGTVAFGGTWETFVRCSVGYRNADIAGLAWSAIFKQSHEQSYLAVVEVSAQAFASPAYLTVWAVVDLLLAVIVPQLAKITVIACRFQVAVFAMVSRFLGRATCHT